MSRRLIMAVSPLVTLMGLLVLPRSATAYPCFYEMSAPTRQSSGTSLMAGVVDSGTGAFVKHFECMSVAGTIPLHGAIFYKTQDASVGPFGAGTSTPYDWFVRTSVAWPGSPYVLIGPGNKHYVMDSAVGGVYKDTRDPDVLGTTLSFTGQPTGVWCTLTWKNQLKFQFDTYGGLIKIVDRYLNTVTITRNQINGFPAWIYLGTNTNRFIKYIQDAGNNHVVKVQAQYSYLGSLRSWWIGYDLASSAGKMVTLSDPFSNGYTNTGHTYNFTWTSYTRSDGVVLPLLATIADPRSMVPVSLHYGTAGRISSMDSTLGGATTFSYSAAIGADGSTTGVDPTGGSTTLSYAWHPYGHGYQTTQIKDNSKNETTTVEHSAAPTYLPTAMVDYRNRRRTFTWDMSSGDMTGFTAPTVAGGTAAYTVAYDQTFHIRNRMTDPLSRVYQWVVDGSGNVTSYTTPASDVTSFTYNAQGQLQSSTNPLNQTTTWGRDTYGLPLSIIDAAGHTSAVSRNDMGLVTQVTDPTGAQITYSYDLMNRRTTVTHWLNGQPLNTNYTFDAVGNMLTATDNLGHVWSWSYDCIGNILQEMNPLNQVRTWTWNGTNNLASYTDFTGARSEATYLADGRLSTANFRKPNGTIESTITYNFDASTHLVASVADTQAGTVSYQRDILDQLTSFAGPNGSLTYQYDNLGRRTQTQVAGQNPIAYTYNSRGNIATVAQDGLTTSFVYDPCGRLCGQNFPNGVITAKEYDAAGLVDEVCSSKNGVMFDVTTYVHDAAGKTTSLTANGVTTTLAYDPLNRLVSAASPGNSFTWTYNNAGMRTSQVLNGVTSSYVYDNANHLSSVGGQAITLDGNGRPLSYNGRTYQWNVRGQLTGYTVPGTSYSYNYDLFGNQVSATTNGLTTNRVFDHQAIVRENTGGSIIDTLNGPSLGGPMKRAGLWYSTNGQGSTTKLTDGTGTVTGSLAYDPFGLATPTGSATATPIQYRSGLSSHPSLVIAQGIVLSTEFGMPLGSIGIHPQGPSPPFNPSTSSHKMMPFDDATAPTDGSDQTAGSKDEDQHRKADSGGCNGTSCDTFSGPPAAGTGEVTPPQEPNSSGSEPGSTVVAGTNVALGVARPDPAFCKPGWMNMTKFQRATGSVGDPFHQYGLGYEPSPATRSQCAINGAERVSFNLDGFDPDRGMSADPTWTDGNMTNSEYQMCLSPRIFPRVNWYQCGQIVPAPANPYGPNPEGAAGTATGANGQEPGSNAGR